MQEIPGQENLDSSFSQSFPIEENLTKEEENRERDFANQLATKVDQIGGKAYIVGGYARDEALRRQGQNIESKDLDIEVYGIPQEKLIEILEQDFQDFGKPDQVGKAFGVIKIGQIDVSLPRKDSKTGSGHRGFEIVADPSLSIKEASKRRDLTINSILLDPLTGELVDPFDGQEDLRLGVLRATDLNSFAEDPLRTLRLAQLAGRFNFRVDPQTAQLARELPLDELPNARVGEEWRKLLLKSRKPSIGLEVAKDLRIIEKLHPELYAIIGVEQESDHHPEGDVWVHSLMSVDVASEIVVREGLKGDQALIITTASLIHDLGKATTTEKQIVRGIERITSYGHDEAGVEPTKSFLSKMEFGQTVTDKVVPLVRRHMYLASNPNPDQSAVRRLSTRLTPSSIQELAWVMEADRRGRGGIAEGLDKIINLIELSQEIGVREEPQKPIIQGRDLIALGFKPGIEFGQVISQVQEQFLDGTIQTKEEAIDLAKKLGENLRNPS